MKHSITAHNTLVFVYTNYAVFTCHDSITKTMKQTQNYPQNLFTKFEQFEPVVQYSNHSYKRTGMIHCIYVILTVLELILSKFPVISWLNQVSTISNEGVMRLTNTVKCNHTGTFIREFITRSSYQEADRCLGSTKCLRPYHVEYTSSRPITEVKQRRARLVLGWVTAWEYRVP